VLAIPVSLGILTFLPASMLEREGNFKIIAMISIAVAITTSLLSMLLAVLVLVI
jgi:hypothetical protein